MERVGCTSTGSGCTRSAGAPGTDLPGSTIGRSRGSPRAIGADGFGAGAVTADWLASGACTADARRRRCRSHCRPEGLDARREASAACPITLASASSEPSPPCASYWSRRGARASPSQRERLAAPPGSRHRGVLTENDESLDLRGGRFGRRCHCTRCSRAWVETEATVTSPSKRVIATELVSASALADAPGCVATFPDADPIRTIEPSSGKANPVTSVDAPGGPTTSLPRPAADRRREHELRPLLPLWQACRQPRRPSRP